MGLSLMEDAMRTEPRGYWTRVFDRATVLLQTRYELTGDQAYWLARREVDAELVLELLQAALAHNPKG